MKEVVYVCTVCGRTFRYPAESDSSPPDCTHHTTNGYITHTLKPIWSGEAGIDGTLVVGQ